MTKQEKKSGLAKFQEVFADDALYAPVGMDCLMKRRTLQWKSDDCIPLATAAWWYSQIVRYNSYEPSAIPCLLAAFPGDGIEVTPARDSSVCIFLHVPGVGDLRKRVAEFVTKHLNADEVDWQDDDSLRIWWD